MPWQAPPPSWSLSLNDLIFPYALGVWHLAKHNSCSYLSSEEQSKISFLYPLHACCRTLRADQVCGHTLDSCWGCILMSAVLELLLPRADARSSPLALFLHSCFWLKCRAACWFQLSFTWLDGFHCNPLLQALRACSAPCSVVSADVLKRWLLSTGKMKHFMTSSIVFTARWTPLIRNCPFLSSFGQIVLKISSSAMHLSYHTSLLYRNKYPHCYPWFTSLKVNLTFRVYFFFWSHVLKWAIFKLIYKQRGYCTCNL